MSLFLMYDIKTIYHRSIKKLMKAPTVSRTLRPDYQQNEQIHSCQKVTRFMFIHTHRHLENKMSTRYQVSRPRSGSAARDPITLHNRLS